MYGPIILSSTISHHTSMDEDCVRVFKCPQVLAMPQFYLSLQDGGLSLINHVLKCEALCQSSAIATILHPEDIYAALQKMMWSEVRHMPLQYRQAKEALATLVEHLPEGTVASARYLYIRASKTSAVIPSVVNRTPTIRWRRPWKILADLNLSSDLRAAAFGCYNNIVTTQQRKYSIHLTADPACPLCGNTDTALHRAISCVYATPIWKCCRVRVRKIIRDERGDVSDTHMLHCDFFTFLSVRRRAAAWYILHAIGFLVDHSNSVTVQDFVQLLRRHVKARQTASFTSLGRYSLSAGVDRFIVRDLGCPDGSQIVEICGDIKCVVCDEPRERSTCTDRDHPQADQERERERKRERESARAEMPHHPPQIVIVASPMHSVVPTCVNNVHGEMRCGRSSGAMQKRRKREISVQNPPATGDVAVFLTCKHPVESGSEYCTEKQMIPYPGTPTTAKKRGRERARWEEKGRLFTHRRHSNQIRAPATYSRASEAESRCSPRSTTHPR
ncbi:hypothetical protein PR048_001394 [Dryococelus australis]|uniref:Uncharacterized protein n=1 Tax=Dryococelus australis TaxID=614101 RepID=A0ABQ9IH93_9NEOP|nr:hypothetical protein PR048_001394 [Dryococelus australis]